MNDLGQFLFIGLAGGLAYMTGVAFARWLGNWGGLLAVVVAFLFGRGVALTATEVFGK